MRFNPHKTGSGEDIDSSANLYALYENIETKYIALTVAVVESLRLKP